MEDNYQYIKLSLKKYRTYIMFLTIGIILSTQSTMISSAHAHSGKLLNINGKDYWIWVASIGEPGIIDVMGGAEAYIYEADPQDPLNRESNKTKPVDGMDSILKFNVIAGDKNKTFDLQQVWNSTGPETGHYQSPFIHTVDTSYDYELFGNWNGTKFSATWTCIPEESSETLQTNQTKILSEKVMQKAESGSFACPIPISQVSFPESSMSNIDIQAKFKGVNSNTSASDES